MAFVKIVSFFFNLEFKVLYNYFCAMKSDILAGRDIFFDIQAFYFGKLPPEVIDHSHIMFELDENSRIILFDPFFNARFSRTSCFLIVQKLKNIWLISGSPRKISILLDQLANVSFQLLYTKVLTPCIHISSLDN